MTATDWMRQGTTLFLATLEDMSDDRLDRPCALPGWTGRHLVAHLHFNALGLRRLTAWAATGQEQRMYPSPEHRAAQIEEGATLPAAELRDLVQRSAADLDRDLAVLTDDQWTATVATAQARDIPATDIPWMRTREVFVHAVDLGAGVTFDDIPVDVATALAVDVVRQRGAAGGAAGLAGWLTGRLPDAPVLGPWL